MEGKPDSEGARVRKVRVIGSRVGGPEEGEHQHWPDGLHLSAVLSISCQCTGGDGNTVSRQPPILRV